MEKRTPADLRLYVPPMPAQDKAVDENHFKLGWNMSDIHSVNMNVTCGFRQQLPAANTASSLSPSVPSVPFAPRLVADPVESFASDEDIFSTLGKDHACPRSHAPEQVIPEHEGINHSMECIVCGKAFGILSDTTFKHRSVIHSSCLQGWIRMSKDVRGGNSTEPLPLCTILCSRIPSGTTTEVVYESEVRRAVFIETAEWFNSTNVVWSEIILRLISEM